MRVRGTWPSYVGGGLFSTENVLEQVGVNSKGAIRRLSRFLTEAREQIGNCRRHRSMFRLRHKVQVVAYALA